MALAIRFILFIFLCTAVSSSLFGQAHYLNKKSEVITKDKGKNCLKTTDADSLLMLSYDTTFEEKYVPYTFKQYQGFHFDKNDLCVEQTFLLPPPEYHLFSELIDSNHYVQVKPAQWVSHDGAYYIVLNSATEEYLTYTMVTVDYYDNKRKK